MAVNQFFGIGRLTRDPECKTTKGDKLLATFSIALNEKGKNGKEYTTFINIECWERLAQLVRDHLAKGRKVLVNGRIKQETWENEHGKQSRHVIVARSIEFLDAPTTFDPEEFADES